MTSANPFYIVRGLTNWQLPVLEVPAPEIHPEAVGSFDEALAIALHKESNFSIVFCDLFDTLIQRDVAPAEFIHEKTARYLHGRLAAHGVDVPTHDLLALRRAITAELCARGHAQGHHGEYRLKDMFEALAAKTLPAGNHAALALDCLDYEMRQERRHIGPVPGAAAFLEALKQKYRIVCLSDTPMDGAEVQKLIRQAGLGDYIDKVYVSSDIGANKRSGSLFDYALGEEEMLPGQVLHIGDNPLSDNLSPRAKGIESILLQHRELHSLYAEMEQRIQYAQTFGCPEYLERFPALSSSESEAFIAGRESFSLAFALFALQILELDQRHQFDQIYFVARDGYLPYQAFLRLAKTVDSFDGDAAIAKADYLHLSRASTLCPRNDEELDEALRYSTLAHGRNAIPSLFSTLGFDVGNYRPYLEQEGLAQDDMASASLETLAKLRHQLVSPNSALGQKLKQDIACKRQHLQTYLTNKGFFSAKKILLVDAGWRYRIAHNLEAAFGDQSTYPEMHCALLGYTDELPSNKTTVHPGFLFDARRINPIEKLLVQHREVIEAIAVASEGTCTGYRRASENEVIPVIQPGHYDDSVRREIQSGILAGVDAFGKQFNRFQLGQEFQLHALVQLLRPIIDATHSSHRALASLALPNAKTEIQKTDDIGSFISDVTSQMTVNMGQGDSMSSPTKNLEKLLGLIQQAMATKEPIILWGMGLIGKLIYPHLSSRIAHVVDMDSSLHGQSYGQHVIKSPEVLPMLDWESHTVIFTPLTRARPTLLGEKSGNVFFSAEWIS